MAEPVLDQPRVMAGIGQGVAAGVAQHVGMDPERGNLSVWSRLLSTETVACDYCGSTPPTLPVSSCSSCSSFGPHFVSGWPARIRRTKSLLFEYGMAGLAAGLSRLLRRADDKEPPTRTGPSRR